MPKHPMDYTRTVIYKICCNDLNVTDVYVGHTTCFNKRKWEHKHHSNYEKSKRYNSKVYQSIRDNGGWDNWCMIQICEYPCKSLQEAITEERRYYELLNAKLNTNHPGRGQKENYYEKRDEKLLQKKEYRQKNKQILSEKKKEYRQKKLNYVRQQGRLSYEKHKNEILEKGKQLYTCVCGSNTRTDNKWRHEKSIKHIEFIQNNL